MKTGLIAAALIAFNTSAGVAEPVASVRTRMITPEESWVGQRMSLVIELSAPGYFASSPVFDLPHVPGVLIFPPVGSPTLDAETTDGVEYTVQRHGLMVFSQKPGEITIPPFEIRISTKTHALDKDSTAGTLKTQPVSFTTKQPPGFRPGEPVITSADLALEESWKPEPKDGKPGDAFVRTLTWKASDVPGMAFPPLAHDDMPGLGIYQDDPLVTDHGERGAFLGQRVDTVTYVCKTGGTFTIPAKSVRWWDPAEGKMKSVKLPARTFTVTAPPSPPEPLWDRIAGFYRRNANTILMCLLGCVSASVLIRKTWPFWNHLYRQLYPRHLSPLNPP